MRCAVFGGRGGGGSEIWGLRSQRAVTTPSKFPGIQRFLLLAVSCRSLLKGAMRGAQYKLPARKIAGCSGHAYEGGGESSSPKPAF